jgi:phosphoglycolate phosphatase-like HAD superfamily hydrolase
MTLPVIRRALFALGWILWSALSAHAGEPLPSWNEGASKRAIIAFVEKVTDEKGGSFVPSSERIAVFDNDGTLWPENPLPFQISFTIDELKRRLPDHPEWKSDEYIQAALSGDLKVLLRDHYKGLFHIIFVAGTGMTTGEFDQNVRRWFATAIHPRFNRGFDRLAYQPMLEVLSYLRANGFKTYIVSGGGLDFMRVFSERLYGVVPEQVIGSHTDVVYEMKESGPVLVKTMNRPFVDDGAGKPESIHQFIGRRPIAAFGNSDGDKAMLEYTTIGNPLPSLGLLVHHTDAEREYVYDANPRSSGKLVTALADAPQRGWVVVDMRKDWRSIFSE